MCMHSFMHMCIQLVSSSNGVSMPPSARSIRHFFVLFHSFAGSVMTKISTAAQAGLTDGENMSTSRSTAVYREHSCPTVGCSSVRGFLQGVCYLQVVALLQECLDLFVGGSLGLSPALLQGLHLGLGLGMCLCPPLLPQPALQSAAHLAGTPQVVLHGHAMVATCNPGTTLCCSFSRI